MIITELRLHPFAGLKMNVPIHFNKELNVIWGPNEAGKSTLINAVLSSFFLLINPRKNSVQYQLLKTYMPLPSGDTIKVSIAFSVSGKIYKLDRAWGNNPKIELVLPNNNFLASEDNVSKTLMSLLSYGEATYRNVLVASQSDIARSLNELQSNTEVLNSVGEALRKTVFEAEGVSLDSLNIRIEQEINNLTENWDLDKNCPTNNRGIDNPWKKDVGEILETYYGRETLRMKLRDGREAEKKLSVAEFEMKETQQRISKISEELNRLKSISGDIRKRNEIEMEVKVLANEESNLLLVSKEWPVAEHEIKKLNELNKVMLEDESIKTLEKQINILPQIELSRLEEIRRIRGELSKLEALLSEAKLTGKIEAKSPIHLTVKRDEEEAESVNLDSNAEFNIKAGQKFYVEALDEGWKIDVRSGERELEDIKIEHEKISKQLQEIISSLSVSSISDPEELYKKSEDLKKALDSKRREIETKIKENNWDIQRYSSKIEEWKNTFESCDDVNTRLGEIKYNTKNLKLELSNLSPLPEGMENSDQFFDFLSNNEHELESLRDKQIELVKVVEEAKHNLPDTDIREMEEQFKELEQRFEMLKRRAQLVLKVKEVFERVVEDLDKNTFGPLEYSFAKYLSLITANRYVTNKIRNIVPSAIVKKESGEEIGLDFLSTGTKDGVAIALRLAMAEFLLAGRDGFMIMDDPLVNLDPERKKFASDMLKEFSRDFQLLISTCDPSTSELLGGNLIDIGKLS